MKKFFSTLKKCAVYDIMYHYKLQFIGENAIPRAPHFYVADGNVRNGTLRRFYILFMKGKPPLRGGFPFKPFPTLLHAHKFVAREHANSFSAIYGSKPLQYTRDSRSLCLW